MRETWTDILLSSFREVVQRLALAAPRLVAFVTLILLGWIGAAVARRLTVRILHAADLDARCGRWGLTAPLRGGGRRARRAGGILHAADLDARWGRWGLTATLRRGGIRETPVALFGRLERGRQSPAS